MNKALMILLCIGATAAGAAVAGDTALALEGGWWTPQGALADSHNGLWSVGATVGLRVLDELEVYTRGCYGEAEFVEDFWESGVPDFEPRGRMLSLGLGARYGFPLQAFFPYLRAGVNYGFWLSHQPVPQMGWFPAQSEAFGIDAEGLALSREPAHLGHWLMGEPEAVVHSGAQVGKEGLEGEAVAGAQAQGQHPSAGFEVRHPALPEILDEFGLAVAAPGIDLELVQNAQAHGGPDGPKTVV